MVVVLAHDLEEQVERAADDRPRSRPRGSTRSCRPTPRRSPSMRSPIIAMRRKPSVSGSVTATICTTPDSMRRCTRWRTAASESPTAVASFVYGRRPSLLELLDERLVDVVDDDATGRCPGPLPLRRHGGSRSCPESRPALPRRCKGFRRLRPAGSADSGVLVRLGDEIQRRLSCGASTPASSAGSVTTVEARRAASQPWLRRCRSSPAS